MILGEIISRASGVPYEEYVMKNVVEPMGMDHTFFKIPSELLSQVCMAEEWEENHLKDTSDRTGKPPRAAGGLYSTMLDMWKFGMMFLNHDTYNGNKILGRKTLESMTRYHVTNVKAYHWADEKIINYGLGVGIRNDEFFSPGTFGHEGAGYSAWYIDPKEQFIAIYFVPTKLGWIPEGVITPRNIMWSGIR
jgi:CubicO group peptidase (beta-lactamase class C family)